MCYYVYMDTIDKEYYIGTSTNKWSGWFGSLEIAIEKSASSLPNLSGTWVHHTISVPLELAKEQQVHNTVLLLTTDTLDINEIKYNHPEIFL